MKKLLEFIKKLLGGKSSGSSDSSGFTLIELLIVIAVVGVLAASVLIALNPLEQFRRSRDAGLKQTVSAIGRQLQSNYTIAQMYPDAPSTANTWLTQLRTDGVIVQVPRNTGLTVTCTAGGGTATADVQSGYCYKENSSTAGTGNFVIYARLAATVEKARGGNCADPAYTVYYLYSSVNGRAGVLCLNAEPAIAAYTFLDN